MEDLFSHGPERFDLVEGTVDRPRLCGVPVSHRQVPTSTLMRGLVDCICQPKAWRCFLLGRWESSIQYASVMQLAGAPVQQTKNPSQLFGVVERPSAAGAVF